jgi:hypothetical protein
LEQNVEAEPITVWKCRADRGPEIILSLALDDGECAVDGLVCVFVHDRISSDGWLKLVLMRLHLMDRLLRIAAEGFK